MLVSQDVEIWNIIDSSLSGLIPSDRIFVMMNHSDLLLVCARISSHYHCKDALERLINFLVANNYEFNISDEVLRECTTLSFIFDIPYKYQIKTGINLMTTYARFRYILDGIISYNYNKSAVNWVVCNCKPLYLRTMVKNNPDLFS